MLRKQGYSDEWIMSLLSRFPDPIDYDRDGEALLDEGISLDRLIDRMGGSPL